MARQDRVLRAPVVKENVVFGAGALVGDQIAGAARKGDVAAVRADAEISQEERVRGGGRLRSPGVADQLRGSREAAPGEQVRLAVCVHLSWNQVRDCAGEGQDAAVRAEG